MTNIARLLLVCAVLLAPGCASVRMFGDDGRHAAPAELADAAARADVLIIGEQHGHPAGLAAAADAWERVLKRCPDAALSLEFFERDAQGALDDYLAGTIDSAAMEWRTGRTAGNYPPGHRRMVEAARAAGVPVIASNAPRALVRSARSDGYDALRALPPEQAALVRIPDALPEGRYRDEFVRLMTGALAHSHGAPGSEPAEPPPPEELERRALDMFLAQSLWDWTMAESIVRALEDGRRPVVHVVGQFHSDFGGGLVQAIERLRPGTRIVTASVSDRHSRERLIEDAGRADFVIYAGPAPGAD